MQIGMYIKVCYVHKWAHEFYIIRRRVEKLGELQPCMILGSDRSLVAEKLGVGDDMEILAVAKHGNS